MRHGLLRQGIGIAHVVEEAGLGLQQRPLVTQLVDQGLVEILALLRGRRVRPRERRQIVLEREQGLVLGEELLLQRLPAGRVVGHLGQQLAVGLHLPQRVAGEIAERLRLGAQRMGAGGRRVELAHQAEDEAAVVLARHAGRMLLHEVRQPGMGLAELRLLLAVELGDGALGDGVDVGGPQRPLAVGRILPQLAVDRLHQRLLGQLAQRIAVGRRHGGEAMLQRRLAGAGHVADEIVPGPPQRTQADLLGVVEDLSDLLGAQRLRIDLPVGLQAGGAHRRPCDHRALGLEQGGVERALELDVLQLVRGGAVREAAAVAPGLEPGAQRQLAALHARAGGIEGDTVAAGDAAEALETDRHDPMLPRFSL